MDYYCADLHVHTVLSPCAEVEMIPPLIVRRALQAGLALIAVTDHHSAENVAATIEAAAGTGLTVLPGMEVQTREEVHLVCLFDSLAQVMAWQENVYGRLPPLQNREDVFGAQFVVDATGDYVRSNERLLLTSTSFTLEEAVDGVRALGGLCLAAHADRPSFSVIANLGFIPPGLNIAGVELSRLVTPAEAVTRFPQLKGYPLVRSGDAHRLDELINKTLFKIEKPTVAELLLALAGRDGRKVLVE